MPIFLHVWWVTWLASKLFDNLASRPSLGLSESSVALAIGLALSLAAAALAIHLVRELQARVTACLAARVSEDVVARATQLEPWN